jgi:GDPmannose 4,6-dehydratase
MVAIQPDTIIHLAGISSSIKAFNDPLNTININGVVTANMCDIIHKNNWNIKLFNASSSEIYKGHINYDVKEDDYNMFHIHPYSIAKIMGHSIIDFYRNTYNLPFSNGVIFTTESYLKSNIFLLNKVSEHISSGVKEPLVVGNLDSYRNILHASDVTKAIHIIVQQEKGDNYLVCSDKNYKMADLVIQMYLMAGIKLIKRDNIFYSDDNLPIIITNESDTTNINGYPTKLKKLGWNNCVSIDEILKEIYLKTYY